MGSLGFIPQCEALDEFLARSMATCALIDMSDMCSMRMYACFFETVNGSVNSCGVGDVMSPCPQHHHCHSCEVKRASGSGAENGQRQRAINF
mmetsp:Transcript_2145/g.4886  ORF Transcript_2145/g.4886 Transcript_2145/m.4886 type:complete len:92 (-) Transcript_2145:119-394(-)